MNQESPEAHDPHSRERIEEEPRWIRTQRTETGLSYAEFAGTCSEILRRFRNVFQEPVEAKKVKPLMSCLPGHQRLPCFEDIAIRQLEGREAKDQFSLFGGR
jgi:hypothetical protein